MITEPWTDSKPEQTYPAEAADRPWAIVAHLACFANFWFPFAGLIATVLIGSLRPAASAFERAHVRAALNFEIAISIAYAVILGTYLAVFATIAYEWHVDPIRSMQWQLDAPKYVMAIIAVAFCIGLASAIAACLGARAASRGWAYRYAFVPTFVR